MVRYGPKTNTMFRNINLWKIICPLLLLSFWHESEAQNFAIKTNLLHDATETLNLGIEGRLADKWTIDLSGSIDAWDVKDDPIWRHAYVQPEVRWWLCDTFSGHFLALHAHGGIYNVGGIRDSRYQGWFAGAGIGYGYDLILSRHWNLEFEIGAGYAYTLSDRFECDKCGSKLGQDIPHHYFGLTKAAVSLVFLF